MAILAPGTFRVSDYRKPIPERVKRAALVLAARKIALHSEEVEGELTALFLAVMAGKVEFDHRPPLQDRPYDTEAREFTPPQLSPWHIDPVPDAEHIARTVGAHGRTERGDADRRKRVRSLANKTEAERVRAAAKAGQHYEPRTDIPEPTKGSQKPRAKIRSRGFEKGGPKRKIARRPKKEKPHKPPARRF